MTDGQTDGQNYDSQDRASIARAVKIVLTHDTRMFLVLRHIVSELWAQVVASMPMVLGLYWRRMPV